MELSEKIKTSFDSSDASVQDLQNRITELNNQLSQRKRWASGTYDQRTIKSDTTRITMNLSFTPSIIIVTCGIAFNWINTSVANCRINFVTNINESEAYRSSSKKYDGDIIANIINVSSGSFTLKFEDIRG